MEEETPNNINRHRRVKSTGRGLLITLQKKVIKTLQTKNKWKFSFLYGRRLKADSQFNTAFDTSEKNTVLFSIAAKLGMNF